MTEKIKDSDDWISLLLKVCPGVYHVNPTQRHVLSPVHSYPIQSSWSTFMQLQSPVHRGNRLGFTSSLVNKRIKNAQ